jgi:predicted enzyme related to lactoylglutathione lyase
MSARFLVNLDVDDLEKAVRFYNAAFGLSVGRRIDSGCVEMTGGPTPIYLLETPAGTPASSATTQTRTFARHWTPLHLDFVVDDVDAAVRRAVDAGARVEQPITTHAWGKLALMADPFGHGFCFIQFLGRGYDEVALADNGGKPAAVREAR